MIRLPKNFRAFLPEPKDFGKWVHRVDWATGAGIYGGSFKFLLDFFRLGLTALVSPDQQAVQGSSGSINRHQAVKD